MRQQTAFHHHAPDGEFKPARQITARSRERIIQRGCFIHGNYLKARFEVGAQPVNFNIAKSQAFERSDVIVKKIQHILL